MSGGSSPWSASGIFVGNCSFCTGWTLIVTPGFCASKSLATFTQTDFSGSLVALGHQVSVTGLLEAALVDPADALVLALSELSPLPHAVANTIAAPAATAATAVRERKLRMSVISSCDWSDGRFCTPAVHQSYPAGRLLSNVVDNVFYGYSLRHGAEGPGDHPRRRGSSGRFGRDRLEGDQRPLRGCRDDRRQGAGDHRRPGLRGEHHRPEPAQPPHQRAGHPGRRPGAVQHRAAQRGGRRDPRFGVRAARLLGGR